MELDQDLPLSSSFVGVLEWEWDDEHTGEQGMAEPAKPAGEAAMLEPGSSMSDTPAIYMSLWLSKLVAWVLLSRR